MTSDPILKTVRALDREILEATEKPYERHAVEVEPDHTVNVSVVGTGRPVVFLHPAGFFGTIWAPIVQRIEGIQAILIDLPGHGSSSGIDFRTTDPKAHHIKVIAAVLDHLGIEQADFVGNSIGGQCGLWMAAHHPERVVKLMVVGVPAAAFPGTKADLGLALVGVPGLGGMLLRLPRPTRLHERFIRKPLGRKAFKQLSALALKLHRAASDRPEWRLTLTTLMARTLRWRRPRSEYHLTADEMAAIQCPTLLYWGRRDIYGTSAIAHKAAEQLSDVNVDVVEGGHLPYLDDPYRFSEVLQRFLG